MNARLHNRAEIDKDTNNSKLRGFEMPGMGHGLFAKESFA